MTQTWENKILKYDFGWKGFDYKKIEEDLNAHGRQGWELIETMIPSLGTGQSLEIVAVLKRPGAS